MRFKGECVILEVKAKTGKAKSLTTVLKTRMYIMSRTQSSWDNTMLDVRERYSPFHFIWDFLLKTRLQTLSFLILI